MTPRTFGDALRQYRKTQGLTIAALSRLSNVPENAISRLETGSRDARYLTLGTAVRLARALGVSLDCLCAEMDVSGVLARGGKREQRWTVTTKDPDPWGYEMVTVTRDTDSFL